MENLAHSGKDPVISVFIKDILAKLGFYRAVLGCVKIVAFCKSFQLTEAEETNRQCDMQ